MTASGGAAEYLESIEIHSSRFDIWLELVFEVFLCLMVISQRRWPVFSVARIISHARHGKPLVYGRMQSRVYWNVTICWIPAGGRSAYTNHTLIVHHPIGRRKQHEKVPINLNPTIFRQFLRDKIDHPLQANVG